MSYNEQNLIAYLIFAAVVLLIYRDKPNTAILWIVGAGVYLLFTGRLPIALEALP